MNKTKQWRILPTNPAKSDLICKKKMNKYSHIACKARRNFFVILDSPTYKDIIWYISDFQIGKDMARLESHSMDDEELTVEQRMSLALMKGKG